MVPAHQRLAADDLAAEQVHLGLVDQTQLSRRRRQAQQRLEVHPLLHLLVHFRIEVGIGVAAAVLGPVHGLVGMLDQRLRVPAVLGERTHADTDRQMDLAPLQQQRRTDAGNDVLRDGMRLPDIIQIVEQHHELIAAVARNGMTAGQGFQQARADRLDDFVSKRMAVGIVDHFEPVQIEQKHCNRPAGNLRLGDQALEPFLQQVAVGQVRERIVRCQMAQQPLGPLALGDVAAQSHEAAHALVHKPHTGEQTGHAPAIGHGVAGFEMGHAAGQDLGNFCRRARLFVRRHQPRQFDARQLPGVQARHTLEIAVPALQARILVAMIENTRQAVEHRIAVVALLQQAALGLLARRDIVDDQGMDQSSLLMGHDAAHLGLERATGAFQRVQAHVLLEAENVVPGRLSCGGGYHLLDGPAQRLLAQATEQALGAAIPFDDAAGGVNAEYRRIRGFENAGLEGQRGHLLLLALQQLHRLRRQLRLAQAYGAGHAYQRLAQPQCFPVSARRRRQHPRRRRAGLAGALHALLEFGQRSADLTGHARRHQQQAQRQDHGHSKHPIELVMQRCIDQMRRSAGHHRPLHAALELHRPGRHPMVSLGPFQLLHRACLPAIERRRELRGNGQRLGANVGAAYQPGRLATLDNLQLHTVFGGQRTQETIERRQIEIDIEHAQQLALRVMQGLDITQPPQRRGFGTVHYPPIRGQPHAFFGTFQRRLVERPAPGVIAARGLPGMRRETLWRQQIVLRERRAGPAARMKPQQDAAVGSALQVAVFAVPGQHQAQIAQLGSLLECRQRLFQRQAQRRGLGRICGGARNALDRGGRHLGGVDQHAQPLHRSVHRLLQIALRIVLGVGDRQPCGAGQRCRTDHEHEFGNAAHQGLKEGSSGLLHDFVKKNPRAMDFELFPTIVTSVYFKKALFAATTCRQ